MVNEIKKMSKIVSAREIFGVGGAATIYKGGHPGPTKKPVESAVEREDRRREIVGSPRRVMYYLNELRDITSRGGDRGDPSSRVRKLHELRAKYSEIIGPGQMREAAALLALSSTLPELGFHGEVVEDYSGLLLLIRRDGKEPLRCKVQVVEQKELRFYAPGPNSAPIGTLEIGDNFFDSTTGAPDGNLKRELAQVLKGSRF